MHSHEFPCSYVGFFRSSNSSGNSNSSSTTTTIITTTTFFSLLLLLLGKDVKSMLVIILAAIVTSGSCLTSILSQILAIYLKLTVPLYSLLYLLAFNHQVYVRHRIVFVSKKYWNNITLL